MFFTGLSEMSEDGYKLVHASPGEVMGPGTGPNKGRISVMFPGNKGNVSCDLAVLSRRKPPSRPLTDWFDIKPAEWHI